MWRIWVAALFWGLNWPAVKILLEGISPWTLRTVGLAGGAALLAIATSAMGHSLAIPRSQWRTLVVASVLNVTCFNVFAVFAQLNMPASRAAILTFTMPLWAAILSWAFLGERIDRLRAAALLLGGSGLALLCLPFWPVLSAGGVPVGLVYVLGAAITWAIGTVYSKRNPIGAEVAAVTTWQVALAAVACGVGMVLFETPRLDLTRPDVSAALAYHICLPQALSYLMWFSLIGRVPASTASLGTLLIPIFGVAGAMAILGERPEATDYVGFALILGGIALDQGWRAWRAPR